MVAAEGAACHQSAATRVIPNDSTTVNPSPPPAPFGWGPPTELSGLLPGAAVLAPFAFRRASLGPDTAIFVPLVGRLSNPEFKQTLEKLLVTRHVTRTTQKEGPEGGA